MKNKPAYPKSKLQKIWDAKSKRRKALAMLPFEKKIQILSELQKIAEPIERSKGKQVKVWKTAVEELAGAWKDMPAAEEIRSFLGKDAPREKL